jgi:hypothetical protein
MADLRFDEPATDEIELDEETLAELARRRERARHGRSVPIEEVRQLIPKWISEFASQRTR